MMLMQKPLCVCEITNILEISTATVSSHLSYLRQTGFIEDEKDGKWINYKIARNISETTLINIMKFLPEWFSDEDIIKSDLAKVKSIDRHIICCNFKKDKKEIFVEQILN